MVDNLNARSRVGARSDEFFVYSQALHFFHPFMAKPEEAARKKIDAQLAAWGWTEAAGKAVRKQDTD